MTTNKWLINRTIIKWILFSVCYSPSIFLFDGINIYLMSFASSEFIAKITSVLYGAWALQYKTNKLKLFCLS